MANHTKKSEKTVNTSSNKRALLLVGVPLVFVLLLSGLFVLLKYQAEKKYTDVLSSLNISEQKRNEYVISEMTDINQLVKNDNSLVYDDNYNYTTYKEKYNDSSRIIEQFSTRYKTFCDNFQKDYFDSTDIPKNGEIFLLAKSKINDLKQLRALMVVREDETNGCKDLNGVIASLKLSNEMNQVDNDMNLLGSTNYEDLTTLPSLAKFAEPSYKVEGLASITKVYGSSFDKAVTDRIKSIGLFYESIAAFKAGDQALTDSKYDAYVKAADIATSSGKTASDEYTKVTKAKYAKNLQVENKLFRLMKQMNKSLSNYREELWSAGLISEALYSYSADHEDKVPKTSDINELVKQLRQQKYITIEDVSVNDITYNSQDEKTFSLTYKNNGKSYTFEVVGRN